MTKSTRPAPAFRPLRRERGFIFLILAAIVLFVAGAAIYVFAAILPKVPPIDTVLDYKPKIPLRIYTADNVLIGEFGEEHRDFVPIAKIPPMMKNAVLAIEDARFYEHNGIDWMGAMRAVGSNLRSGFGSGGASTITMQVARNFFLSKEKKLSRKINEIALAWKIEDALTKDQILELYMNQIYLGQRSYGFASAARAYFGKDLDQLTIAETAMLAEFARWLQPTTVFSSYNGRCYDAPLLKTRYRLTRQRCPITPLDHVDLLFPTRRRYRGTWENCRLATIERQLLQIVREDDLPGSEAPAAWLNYLRGGSAVNLRRVAEHNHQDVVTLSLLMQRLVAEERREREILALEGGPVRS